MNYTHDPKQRFKQVQYIDIAIRHLEELKDEILNDCPSSGTSNVISKVKDILTEINDETSSSNKSPNRKTN